MALAEAGGRAILLWTQALQTEITKTAFVPGLPTVNRFDFATGRGARTAVAPHVSDASAVAASWDFAHLRLSAGSTSLLSSGGDIYMVEVVPAITFTFGGVEVNEAGCATDPDGNAIPGLFAAGADMSDAYHRGYGGGLSLAAATGRRAGRLAVGHAAVLCRVVIGIPLRLEVTLAVIICKCQDEGAENDTGRLPGRYRNLGKVYR
jgi:tricarballylate dehydrogenase